MLSDLLRNLTFNRSAHCTQVSHQCPLGLLFGSAFGLNELLDNEFNFKLCVLTSFFFTHCIVFVRLVNENFLPFQYFTIPPANFNTSVWPHLPQEIHSKNYFEVKRRMESSVGWFFINVNISFPQNLSIFTNTSALE